MRAFLCVCVCACVWRVGVMKTGIRIGKERMQGDSRKRERLRCERGCKWWREGEGRGECLSKRRTVKDEDRSSVCVCVCVCV